MIMPDWSTLSLFAAASVALYLSPGPDMLYIASRSIAGGVRVGVVSALGVFGGLLVHMMAAAFGLATVLVLWPVAFTVVKWAGAAYLLYLGVRMLTSGGGASALGRPGPSGDWAVFRQGLLVNVLNPKIALFFLAFLPQFVDPALGGTTAQLLFYGGLFNAGGLIAVLIQAAVFGSLGAWVLSRPVVMRWQRRISGGVLIGLAANLALSER